MLKRKISTEIVAEEKQEEIKEVVKKHNWIHNGGGSFRLGNGKIIKPKQRFQANLEEIPAAFRDIIQLLDVLPEIQKKENKLPEVKPAIYKVVPHPDKEKMFNVVDENNKVINEKPLKEKEAESLADAFNS